MKAEHVVAGLAAIVGLILGGLIHQQVVSKERASAILKEVAEAADALKTGVASL